MITAFLGFTYAMILQQGDVFREHIHVEPIIMYSADEGSWLYTHRQSRFVAAGLAWTETNQYNNKG